MWGKVEEKSDKSVLGLVPRALCMIVKQCHGAETASILGFPTCLPPPRFVSAFAIHLKPLTISYNGGNLSVIVAACLPD